MSKSRALFNTHPIVINPESANLFGLNGAVILQQFHYWITEKQANPSKYANSFKDGHCWVYMSIKSICDKYPFLGSERTVKRVLSDLKDSGVLAVGNYNKMSMDKTNWYRINYQRLNQLVSNASGQNDPIDGDKMARSIVPELPNGSGQNDPSNTRDYPETTAEITLKTPIPPKGASESFEKFWSAYPKRVGKQAAEKAWKKIKPDSRELIFQDLADRPKLDQNWLKDQGQFIPNPTTYLNQGRWLDEWEPPKQQATGTALQIGPGAPVETVDKPISFQGKIAQKNMDFVNRRLAEIEEEKRNNGK